MEDVNTTTESQVVESTTETVEESQAGSKTDSALLLKSLHEEREKRRELEQRLLEKEAQPEPDAFSDEGKVLKHEIDSLKESIVLKDLQEKHPALKDKSSEFDEFRKDYPGVSLEKVSKLFLVEKDLLEQPERKGLEKTTGGARNVPPVGMSTEDITQLRTTNFRKYLKLVQEGKIKV